ncbi:YybH family protein [Streptomyces griseoloalbus]|uniref:Uncharacterized protein (TIGR02246 family) n=1 Tax=Streptomyces griseoloalbus TaxID=67303 RepID=A0A7W8FD97_9ACTN|nr:SgcJ/EcaC family oxidoreductase [Streptomyces albaduncus]MBB5129286.1 uncharacterized protein (TIGR02246 family) [Streptomyces albaduncus]GGV81300.1 hypothetical protein GCM10010294_54660 [Streptomyces griseoloalbus]GGW64991.1 hypothetical protein GCM10010340_48930 [Streptomyces albaduncus]
MAETNDALTAAVLEHAATYVRTFNSGDAAAVDRLYTDDAISVWEKGHPASGEERRKGLAEFLAAKPKLTNKVLESYVTSDTALLVTDWAIDIPATADSAAESISGIGLDVLRLGADGQWRFAIDNPYGKEL